MKLKKLNKKGQVTIEDAPAIILIVGLVFLMMATLALVGEKYGNSVSDTAVTTANETVGPVAEGQTYFITKVTDCGFQNFGVSRIINSTDGVFIPTGNYTINAEGSITAAADVGTVNNSNWDITYTHERGGISCNVTADMNTEIQNNTSIAGIVLTVSLIGIVLSVLIGIFVGFSARRV